MHGQGQAHALDGLAAGSLSMIAALIAVMILVRITKYFGERYGKV